MKIFNLLLLLIVGAPFLFTMGNIASTVDALGPGAAGKNRDRINSIICAGDKLRSATKELAIEEIGFLTKAVIKLGENKIPKKGA